MDVDVFLELGLRPTFDRRIGKLSLDAGAIGATSEWAGSFHVLSMDRHYDDYVLTNRVLGFPAIPGFPIVHPYERLTGKIRATGVTGNIGEAVAAIFARRVLMAQVQEIAHVNPRRPFRRRTSPDYMMRLGRLMPGEFSSVVPVSTPTVGFSGPDWWPVESKARTTAGSALAARNGALRQLIEYWTLLVNTQPAAVGFGMIVTFQYQTPREVRATLILPKSQSQVIDAIGGGSEDRERFGDREPTWLLNPIRRVVVFGQQVGAQSRPADHLLARANPTWGEERE